jgi:3-phenylpropionate/trans-cinnamate dioxygenase ferredoxin component
MSQHQTYHSVAAVQAIPPGTQREITVADQRILICHTAAGLFAVQALCNHARQPLFGGKIMQTTLTCPHHAAKFDLRDGRALEAPAFRPLRTYPVRIVDGRIEVGL